MSNILLRAASFQITNLEFQQPILPKVTIEDKRPLEWFPKTSKYRLWKQDKNGIVYDTIVNLNKHGFRVTSQKSKFENNKHLFFVGCSATFGEGLQDDQTFPYLVSNHFDGRKVVNMGLRGTGVQDHVYFWRALNFPEIYPQSEGMMIYTIIPDHFARLVRTWSYLNWAFPYSTVFKEKSLQMIYDGTVEDKWSYSISKWLKKAHLDYWWLRLSHFYSNYQVKNAGNDVARMLLELKTTYLKRYPKGRFVLNWMRQPIMLDEEGYTNFKMKLAELDIEYWEPPANDKLILESLEKNTWHIKRDGHPTPYAHQLHYQFLSKHLSKEIDWVQ